jgi:hypothetical protein
LAACIYIYIHIYVFFANLFLFITLIYVCVGGPPEHG